MLTVISGYNRMILDELSAARSIARQRRRDSQGGPAGRALTNQLLAFSRRQIIRLSVVNPNAVIVNTEKMLRHVIGEDIHLMLNLAADAGNIKADPGHIEQAVVNLAVNAETLCRRGPARHRNANVRLDETYARTHSGVQPGEFVMIAVSDTGHGMDTETRRHIFEPFSPPR